jgi:hypothetical protein
MTYQQGFTIANPSVEDEPYRILVNLGEPKDFTVLIECKNIYALRIQGVSP